MTYYAREHTDPAGGALTITTDHQGAWITATEGRDEVTVGPFPVAVLELAGSYTRTDEKGWDFNSGAGSAFPSPSKGLRFQRERDDARRMSALWKEVARRAIRDVAGWRSAARIGVRATDAVSEDRDGQRARAEKAEHERDEALRVGQEALNGWREEQEHRAACHDCAQPRPLTADDITDEMVKRARRSLEGDGWIVPGDGVGQLAGALVAALTEPTRPEWMDALAVLVTIEGEERAFIKDPTRAAWVDGIGSVLGTSIIAEHNPRPLHEVGLTPTNPEEQS